MGLFYCSYDHPKLLTFEIGAKLLGLELLSRYILLVLMIIQIVPTIIQGTFDFEIGAKLL